MHDCFIYTLVSSEVTCYRFVDPSDCEKILRKVHCFVFPMICCYAPGKINDDHCAQVGNKVHDHVKVIMCNRNNNVIVSETYACVYYVIKRVNVKFAETLNKFTYSQLSTMRCPLNQ